jgi:hypothetical protein
MKRFGLISVMLVIVLTLGLALVSCSDGNNYDRTIETLFAKTKSVGVNLSAYTSDDEEYDYCTYHQRWEMADSHTATPNFRLADAVELIGWYFPDSPNAVYIPAKAKILPILNSFYDSKYKTNQPQWYPISAPNGTTFYGWYCFYLLRNGNGRFGGTTQTVQSPLWTDHYYFY